MNPDNFTSGRVHLQGKEGRGAPLFCAYMRVGTIMVRLAVLKNCRFQEELAGFIPQKIGEGYAVVMQNETNVTADARPRRVYTRKGKRAVCTVTGSHEKTVIYGLQTMDTQIDNTAKCRKRRRRVALTRALFFVPACWYGSYQQRLREQASEGGNPEEDTHEAGHLGRDEDVRPCLRICLCSSSADWIPRTAVQGAGRPNLICDKGMRLGSAPSMQRLSQSETFLV